MKKNILSFVMAVTMAITICVVPTAVRAEAGDEELSGDATKDTPSDVYEIGNYGAGTTNEVGSSDIDVTSQEVGNTHEIVYSVKVSWGDMKFSYYYGARWNPVTHKYENSNGSSKEGWQESCVNGANNLIQVDNLSNYPVTVNMSFALDNRNRFNVTAANVSNTSVRGLFNVDNDTLKANVNGAIKDTPDPASACGTETIVFDLNSNDTSNKYFNTGDMSELTSKTVYFALWGKPDKDKAKDTPTKAGTIHVTVSPRATS